MVSMYYAGWIGCLIGAMWTEQCEYCLSVEKTRLDQIKSCVRNGPKNIDTHKNPRVKEHDFLIMKDGIWLYVNKQMTVLLHFETLKNYMCWHWLTIWYQSILCCLGEVCLFMFWFLFSSSITSVEKRKLLSTFGGDLR